MRLDIQDGDIVLVHQKGFSWLRLLTGMQYNHVFIIDERIFDDWQIFESIDKGTAPTLLSNYKGQCLTAFRYTGITPEQKQRVRYALAQMGKFKYDYFVPLRAIKRMGIRDTVKTLLKLWSKDYPVNVPHVQDNWIVCSEYAQEAYSRAGIPLQDDKWLLLPDSPLYCPVDEVLEQAWHTDSYGDD